MRSPRIVLLSQLRPELIIKEKTLKLAKQLADKFADRLPSPLQLFSELERWQTKCINLIKEDEHWKKKWLNDLIKQTDNTAFPNVRSLLIFLATLPVSTASAERSF
ncbi:unnamed protein product, partial [Didymodactylos carnosus]